jgi:hypothetical protein
MSSPVAASPLSIEAQAKKQANIFFQQYKVSVTRDLRQAFVEEKEWRALAKNRKRITLDMLSDRADYVTTKMCQLDNPEITMAFIFDSIDSYGTCLLATRIETCALCNAAKLIKYLQDHVGLLSPERRKDMELISTMLDSAIDSIRKKKVCIY